MTTSKSARAAAQRKRAAKQAALEQRRAAVRRRRTFVGIGAALILGAFALWLVTSGGSDDEATTVNDPNGLAPAPSLAESRTWDVTMETNLGTIEMELDGESAPQAVANFVTLANGEYFDGSDCHRLTTAGIYVLQCGDPTGTGSGDPGYKFGPIENAPSDDVYPAGTVAMARAEDDATSMGSQFFVVYEDSTITSDEAGGYTVFGTVTQGLDIVRSIAEGGTITGATDGRPALSVIITKVTAS
ncbi:peptidylprolyl isomerase [Demequina sp. TTPB684]|uniref:peptidylprolyl isomerase n=1 Tax=unclassified Demequina TaxID=2620311 RepID=UPI001CF430E2|nr:MULTISPECIES: peptidylprolyl isomerase [unclassified Demequina]MCB2414070.1 peptidylprolyl isomerase [Demequina sp. TTPB684]UPU89219.1 peptidylprolyl isomerase [Demequina sp. TMPB413]